MCVWYSLVIPIVGMQLQLILRSEQLYIFIIFVF